MCVRVSACCRARSWNESLTQIGGGNKKRVEPRRDPWTSQRANGRGRGGREREGVLWKFRRWYAFPTERCCFFNSLGLAFYPHPVGWGGRNGVWGRGSPARVGSLRRRWRAKATNKREPKRRRTKKKKQKKTSKVSSQRNKRATREHNEKKKKTLSPKQRGQSRSASVKAGIVREVAGGRRRIVSAAQEAAGCAVSSDASDKRLLHSAKWRRD